MVSSTRIKKTKFQCAIKYKPEKNFQQFADLVSDARRAGDIDQEYELVAEAMNFLMKLFGNSADGRTVTNKKTIVSTSYGNEDSISLKD